MKLGYTPCLSGFKSFPKFTATVVVLDNALFHKSKFFKDKIPNLGNI